MRQHPVTRSCGRGVGETHDGTAPDHRLRNLRQPFDRKAPAEPPVQGLPDPPAFRHQDEALGKVPLTGDPDAARRVADIRSKRPLEACASREAPGSLAAAGAAPSAHSGSVRRSPSFAGHSLAVPRSSMSEASPNRKAIVSLATRARFHTLFVRSAFSA
jgi:hypothetical protein